MSPSLLRRSVVLAAFGVLVVAGCSSDGDQTAETTQPVRSLPEGEDRVLPQGDEPEVLGPLGETEAEFETENGLVQVGSADVPDVVASSFPLPDDIDVQLASSTSEQAGFSGVTQLGFAELVGFYDIELPAAGYESTRSRFVDGVVAVYDFDGPDGAGQVAISSAPGGGHSVLVTFSR
jgi:hypothetical protein